MYINNSKLFPYRDDNYAAISMYVKTFEKNLISNQFFLRALDESYSQWINSLREYGIENIDDLYKPLWDQYNQIQGISNDSMITDFFDTLYTSENLKTIFKEKYTKKQFLYFPVSEDISIDRIKTNIEEDNFKVLPESYMSLLPEKVVLQDNVISDILQSIDLKKYDILISNYKKYPFIMELIRIMIDFSNLRYIILMKHSGIKRDNLIQNGNIVVGTLETSGSESTEVLLNQYIKYYSDLADNLKDKNINAIEIVYRKILLNYLSYLKYCPYGLENIVGYLLLKQIETFKINLVDVALKNKVILEDVRTWIKQL